MRRVLHVGVLLMFVTGIAPDVWAGAWTLPKERWYAEYFYRVFQSKKRFDQDGNSSRKAAVGVFRDIRNEWKVEYGVTDWFNLLASVPYQSAHSRDDNSDLLNSNVGDIYVRAKFRLLNKPLLTDLTPLVGSVQFSWKIPSAYDPKESPGLGDGQVDFESRLLLSQSWVYEPYEVWVPVTQPPRLEGPPGSSSREAAMQEAVLVAAYFQEGLRFAEQGRHHEAAQCFQIVAEGDPTHDEAAWMMFNETLAAAQELADSYYGFRPVTEETFEPLLAAAGDESAPVAGAATPRPTTQMETRYAKVAFINLEGGFTARNEEPANEFPLVFEAGFTPWKRLMLVGRLDNVVSVNSTNEDIENWSKWDVRAILNVWGDGFAAVFREGAGPTVNVEVGYTDIVAGRNTEDAFEIYGKLNFFF